jgi:hypothetical protein
MYLNYISGGVYIILVADILFVSSNINFYYDFFKHTQIIIQSKQPTFGRRAGRRANAPGRRANAPKNPHLVSGPSHPH